jgi:hypothetical protein
MVTSGMRYYVKQRSIADLEWQSRIYRADALRHFDGRRFLPGELVWGLIVIVLAQREMEKRRSPLV